MRFETAALSVPARPPGDDAFAVLHRGDLLILAVADGSGGMGRGRDAALGVIAALERLGDPMEVLASCDGSLSGETTAVVVILDENGIRGASVGDSGAWLVTADGYVDLTAGQERKPLLGSGRAVSVAFAGGPLSGTLLLATDGLLKYAPAETLCRIARGHVLADIPAALVDTVRLRSGALHDDTTVVVCR